MKWRFPLGRLAALVFCLALLPCTAFAAGEVNIYSYRQEVLIRPLLDAFTAETGITVNLVSGKADALLERLKSEGDNSPADLLLTNDAGRLIRARRAGVLQAVKSPLLDAVVPAQYRDPDGYWYGLSIRARVVFFAPDRVKAGELSTYEDLADPRWRDRICVRSSSNVYNQSLLAAQVAHHGAAVAEAWAGGVVANMARKPQGGDRDQIRAVAAGACDIAIANTYYYAGMLAGGEDDRRVAEQVAVFWPNQGGSGAHVNVSGIAMTKSAKNHAEALQLMEFMAGDDGQRLYAETVNEYPVKPGASASALVQGLGAFEADRLNLASLADHNGVALRIFDRAGWR